MIVEEAPRPAVPYSHAVVAYGFVFVAGQGPPGPEADEVPDALADQVRQALTNVRTILGSVGSNLRATIFRGEVMYSEGRFVGAGIKKVSAGGGWDGLRRAISSPGAGAILRGHRMLRGESPVGL